MNLKHNREETGLYVQFTYFSAALTGKGKYKCIKSSTTMHACVMKQFLWSDAATS